MLQETQTGDDGCSLYCCRNQDGGHVASGRVLESGMLEDVHNSWVVPYSPLLCINVEYGNSVKSIKHICKYVTKGSDAAMFLLLQHEMLNRLDEEVTTYQQGGDTLVSVRHKDVLRETSYDVQAFLCLHGKQVGPRLTPDQQQAFIAIPGVIGSERGGIVFLDALGGTGKTFLFNLLLAFVKKEKDMALAVASSAHSSNSTCWWSNSTSPGPSRLPLDLARSERVPLVIFLQGTEQGHVLKHLKPIVWDEGYHESQKMFFPCS
ncbi:ATP-dependent DNA helicase [Trichonephila clavipes]|nr:ATP-dependent DNA helicase [Trichonephila clavipes]